MGWPLVRVMLTLGVSSTSEPDHVNTDAPAMIATAKEEARARRGMGGGVNAEERRSHATLKKGL
jgi:hypothetical protein